MLYVTVPLYERDIHQQCVCTGQNAPSVDMILTVMHFPQVMTVAISTTMTMITQHRIL